MAITFLQFKVANNGGTGSSLSVSFDNPIAAGSIIASIVIADEGITSFAMADDKIDGFTDSGLGIVDDTSIGVKAKLGAFLSATTGAKTVTATPNVSFGFCELVVWEIGGLTGALIDKAVSAPGTGNTASSGSTGTLSAAAEAAIGYGIGNDTYTAAGTNWTLDVVTAFADICEHQVVSSNTAIAATANIIGSPTWRMYCVTFMSGGAPSVVSSGWEVQPFQPPYRRQPTRGAFLRGDDGLQAPFVNWKNTGWEVQPFQPPHRKPERAASIMRGDDGIQGLYTAVIAATPAWGWENQPFQPPHPMREKRAAGFLRGDDGTEAKFVQWFNSGWENQPFQPGHPRPERAASWLRGDDGTEAKFVQWFNSGWEVQPFQPRHPRPERAASWLAGDAGIAAPMPITATQTVNWGWESLPPLLRQKIFRYAGIEGRSEFVSFDMLPMGWETLPFQPRHPRPERAGALMRGDDGTQGLYTAVIIATPVWGWENQPFQPPPFAPKKRGAIMRGDDGIERAFVNWLNAGWEIQSFQPSHPRPERIAAMLRGDDGTQAALVNWLNAGWEIQPFQPPHPRPERAASIMRGDDGNEGLYTAVIIAPPAWGWEIQSFQPRHPRPERAAWLIGDAGIQAPFIFVPAAIKDWGWEIPSFQPPHPRPERIAAMLRGDEGIQAAFNRWINSGWEVQTFQPPRPRWERRGNFLRGDEGIQAGFIRWFYTGWEVQPFQPPHRRVERAGAILVGYPGIDLPFIFVPPTVVPLRLRTLMGTGL